jgi:hypothetical protein
MQGFFSALKCARDLADAQGFKTPILILTDNAMLRKHLRQGLFNGFVTTPYSAIHTKQLEGDEAFKAMLTAFVDLRLLAEATCLISCPSGFSHIAVQWGQHACALTVSQCQHLVEPGSISDLEQGKAAANNTFLHISSSHDDEEQFSHEAEGSRGPNQQWLR